MDNPYGYAVGQEVGAKTGLSISKDNGSLMSFLSKGDNPLLRPPSTLTAPVETNIDVQYPTADEWNADPRQYLNRVQLAVGDAIANQSKTRQNGEAAMKLAFQGVTFAEQQEMAAEASRQAMDTANQVAAEQMAMQSAGLSDEQFAALKEQLRAEMANTPTVPTMGNPSMPNEWQMLLSGMAAIGLPSQGFEILQAPFASELRKEIMEFQAANKQYDASTSARAERIRGLYHDIEQMARERGALQDRLAGDRNAELDRTSREKIAQIGADSRLDVQGMRNAMAEAKPDQDAFYKGESFEIRSAARQNYFNKTGIDLGPAAPETPEEKERRLRGDLTVSKTTTENALREGRKKLIDERIKVLGSVKGLNETRKKMIAAVTANLPAESAAKVATAWAAVDNFDSMIATRAGQLDLDILNSNRAAIEAGSQDIKDSLKIFSDTATAARARKDKLGAERRELSQTIGLLNDADMAKQLQPQLDAIDAEIKAADDEIRNAQAQYKSLQDKAKAIADKLRAAVPKGAAPKAGAGASRLTAFGKQLKEAYGGRVEQFNNRDVRGKPGTKSKHATGEAIDYYNSVAKMDSVSEQLTKDSGVTYMIYKGRDWKPGRGWKKYNGVHPHNDHIHIQR